MVFECEVCGVKSRRWKRCVEHYRCDDCGTKEGLCFYTEGVLCGSCKKARVKKRIEVFGGETQNTGLITCPYCGYKFQDSWEFSDGGGEMECSDCGQLFFYEPIVDVTYSTSKI